jgi:hypothetical protein
MCFVWISEQTAVISLYSINWLVFTTETECVYCAVRTESLNTIHYKFQSSTRLPLSVPFHQCSTVISICLLLLPEGRKGEVWGRSKKQCSFRNQKTFDTKRLSLSFSSLNVFKTTCTRRLYFYTQYLNYVMTK